MIISASRRTDIPAFYSDWFMNRIKEGWCLVPNPMNTKQQSRVSLKVDDVDVIVFWSKNPAPLIPHLSELDRRGFLYYFQYTINDYPLALEPNIPSLDSRIKTFKLLSGHVTPLRVVWRYDPIIISNFTPIQYHVERFSQIAEELKGYTKRVMVSVIDYYGKTDRRLTQLEKEEGFTFTRGDELVKDIVYLMKEFSSIAAKNEIEIFTCAEETDYSQLGVTPGRCIDTNLMLKCWSLNLKYKKDAFQRPVCLCATSKDIGVNNTCKHGCTYCYATSNCEIAQKRFNTHDPNSPVLWGIPSENQKLPKIVEDHDSGQIGLFPLDV